MRSAHPPSRNTVVKKRGMLGDTGAEIDRLTGSIRGDMRSLSERLDALQAYVARCKSTAHAAGVAPGKPLKAPTNSPAPAARGSRRDIADHSHLPPPPTRVAVLCAYAAAAEGVNAEDEVMSSAQVRLGTVLRAHPGNWRVSLRA